MTQHQGRGRNEKPSKRQKKNQQMTDKKYNESTTEFNTDFSKAQRDNHGFKEFFE